MKTRRRKQTANFNDSCGRELEGGFGNPEEDHNLDLGNGV